MICNSGQFLVEKLKDKIVTGLLKGSVLDRLCKEKSNKVLAELVDIACNV